MLNLLKSDIRDLALQQIHLPSLLNIPLLHPDFSIDFLKKISRIVKVKIAKPMENILDENIYDSDKNFYFIFDGTVEISLKKSNTSLGILRKGDYFGEYGFITGLSRKASARTLEFCELHVISRTEFIDCLKSATSKEREIFYQKRNKLLYQEDSMEFGVVCYSCQKKGHYAIDCKDTHIKVQNTLMRYKLMKTNARKDFQRTERAGKFALSDNQEVQTICEEMIRRRYIEELDMYGEEDYNNPNLDISRGGNSMLNINPSKVVHKRFRGPTQLNVEICRLF